MNAILRTLAGAAVLVLLAGCSPSAPPESPSPTPTVSTTVSPSPSATPTPEPTPTEPEWTPPDPARWNLVLDTGFDEAAMPKKWDYRLTDIYDAGGRWCSAPVERNLRFEDGLAHLTMSKAAKKLATKVKAAAKRKQAKAGQKQVGCPEGVFDNAMISTQNRFTVGTGTVAARVKFPVEQGAHAGVWLQSTAHQEIDIIETYGWGRGVTSVVHVDGTMHPEPGPGAYLVPEVVADRAWWDAWHVVEVEWTRSKIVFRLDGEVTRELKVKTRKADYFVVLSLLSSDWETIRLTEPLERPGAGLDGAPIEAAELPFGMAVDWVKVYEPKP